MFLTLFGHLIQSNEIENKMTYHILRISQLQLKKTNVFLSRKKQQGRGGKMLMVRLKI